MLFAAALLYWLWIFAGKAGHEPWTVWFKDLQNMPRGVWLTGLAWLLIVLASLVDLQFGKRLYFSATAYDHAVRTAITETIARVGPHPNNPFYNLAGPVPLRYHFFWLLPCGFLTHITGGLAPAKACMFASAVWCGWGFLALIPSTFRFLLGFAGAELRRRSYLAIAFTTVTGLDLFPTMYVYHLGTVYPDMEWWNNNQVTSWWGSALWVPHHFAGLVIGMFGFLIVWQARTATKRSSVFSLWTPGGCRLWKPGRHIDLRRRGHRCFSERLDALGLSSSATQTSSSLWPLPALWQLSLRFPICILFLERARAAPS